MLAERLVIFRGIVPKEYNENFFKEEFVFGSLIYCKDDIVSTIINDEFEAEVLTETVGQFSGELDIDDVMIFEDDIVQVPDDYDTYGFAAGGKFRVIFTKGGFRVTSGKEGRGTGYWLEDGKDYKVIGNMHKNPELLSE